MGLARFITHGLGRKKLSNIELSQSQSAVEEDKQYTCHSFLKPSFRWLVMKIPGYTGIIP